MSQLLYLMHWKRTGIDIRSVAMRNLCDFGEKLITWTTFRYTDTPEPYPSAIQAYWRLYQHVPRLSDGTGPLATLSSALVTCKFDGFRPIVTKYPPGTINYQERRISGQWNALARSTQAI